MKERNIIVSSKKFVMKHLIVSKNEVVLKEKGCDLVKRES